MISGMHKIVDTSALVKCKCSGFIGTWDLDNQKNVFFVQENHFKPAIIFLHEKDNFLIEKLTYKDKNGVEFWLNKLYFS